MKLHTLFRCGALALFLTALLGSSCLYGGDFVLTKNGKPRCVIVADEELSPSEKTAVTELQTFVAEMSGAYLPMGQASTSKPKILIGVRQVKKLYPELDFSGLGDDGYVIRTYKGDLILAGGLQRGTLYAVYTLLGQFGYRWLNPDETTNIVPELPTLVRKDINLREVPQFKQRNLMIAGNSGAWCARNKINSNGWGSIATGLGGSFQTAGSQGHNVFKLLKTAGVAPTDEMLAWWKGKNGTGEGKRTREQLCLTHPDVLAAFVTAQSKLARENPGVPYLVIAPQDNWTYCQCERCDAINTKAESKSGTLVHAANYVAKAVREEFPNLNILIFAYQTTVKPPENMTLEDNIVIGYAPIEANYMRPIVEGHVDVNNTVQANFDAWSKLVKQFFVWDYVVNFAHYNAIYPNLDVLVPNIKYYRDMGVKYFMEQATGNSYNSEFAELKRWVIAQAMWNPDADGQALITEFLQGYYGAAAPAIQEYIDAIHLASRTEIFTSRIYDRMDAPYFQAKYIVPAELAMRKAEALAEGDPALEQRVRLVHLPILYLIAHRMPGGTFWNEMEAGLREKLDLVKIAAQVELTVSECRDMRISEWEPKEGWVAWVDWFQGYAAQYAAGKLPAPKDLSGQIITPKGLKLSETPAQHFRNLKLDDYYIVQGCQFDARAGYWAKSEGASDGWAQEIATDGWTIIHHSSEGEEYQPDQAYDVYVRIKPGKKTLDTGRMFTFGERNQLKGYGAPAERDVSLYEEGEWYIVKLGTVTNPGIFYFASNRKVMHSLYVDCYFLVKK